MNLIGEVGMAEQTRVARKIRYCTSKNSALLIIRHPY